MLCTSPRLTISAYGAHITLPSISISFPELRPKDNLTSFEFTILKSIHSPGVIVNNLAGSKKGEGDGVVSVKHPSGQNRVKS